MTVMRKESIFSTMHAFVFLFSLFLLFFANKQTNKQTKKKDLILKEKVSHKIEEKASKTTEEEEEDAPPLRRFLIHTNREKSLRLLLRERRVVVKLNNKMRPILLKGHERPLTFIKYNSRRGFNRHVRERSPPDAYGTRTRGTESGRTVGHNGAVWTADITRDSKTLATGSAQIRVVNSGTSAVAACFQTFQFDQPVRAVSFAIGDEKMLITTDPFMGVNAAIHIVEITKNREEQTSKILKTISGDGIVNGRLNRVAWGALNETFLTAGEDGVLRVWDVETGKVLHEARDAHKGKPIQHLELSADKTHAITASLDKTAKIFDAQNLELLKTYVADRPVNAAIISPIREHIILGGGQDAMAVTTTSSKAGKFDSKIYHKIFEEEIGGIRGHFGPINALAFCPDGKSFTSGGEDGYARIHHLDNTYFDIK